MFTRRGLAVVPLMLLSCSRSSVEASPAPPLGEPSVPVPVSKPAPYSSSTDRFSIVFPFNGVPKSEDLPEQQTVIGRARATSYYVRQRDVAFDVQVTRFPENSLSRDVPGLLQADRDGALATGNARVVHERSSSVPLPSGASIPALELELELPGDIRAFRLTCFRADASYTLSAAGPTSDLAINEQAFQRFVTSFRLLE